MSREDMDTLLDAAIRASLHLLEKNQEFYPIGAAIGIDGEVSLHAGYTGEEQPPASDVIDVLRSGMKQSASNGEIKATALAADVRMANAESNQSTDAIRVQIEHRDAEPVTCYLPYHIDQGKVVTGEVVAARGERLIFE